MDINGRATHIEDYLVTVRSGQWFGWSDAKNKVYENLIIHDASKDKPTEQQCNDGLAQMQSDHDAKEYQRKRKAEYPAIEDQLDYIYHNGLTKWKADMITPVKEKYPKPD